MPLISRYADVCIPEVSLTDYILKSLFQRKARTAIIELASGRELTFGDIANETIKCASSLYRRGLRKGDIVAICASNSPEYLIIILASAACGAIITTCNPLYTENEIKHQFQHSQPKVIFTVPGTYERVKKVAEVVPSLKKIYTIGSLNGVESYESLVRNDDGGGKIRNLTILSHQINQSNIYITKAFSAFPKNIQIDPKEDILCLPYSSGTTGLAKGVMLTHYNFISSLRLYKVAPGFHSDCIYSVLPLFHIYGLLTSFLALDQGIRHVLDVRFDLKNMLHCIQKYKVTRFAGVPPMLLAVAKSPLLEKYDVSSLLTINCGAAPMPPEVANILKKTIGCAVIQGWGLTEAVPITNSDVQKTPIQSVGSVSANTKLKVIDLETGAELGPQEHGELCLKGPQVMRGYFKNPTATMNTIDPDGWLHTGDIGYYDDDEMIYIVDRLKELIKYKGFQVAPAELEAILISHPKIADAAVVGVPDPVAGEVAKAFIVRKDPSVTKDEIHTFVGEKLSKYKHLHGGIEFRDSILKTPTGKIMRRALRDLETNSKL